MKTVLEVIQSTTAYFARNGVESPRLNIEHLLAHVLGNKRMDLYLEFDRSLSDADLKPLRELVRRRAQGEPLQHLLGTADFNGRVFVCDKRALVPRPETEQLVALTLADGVAERVLDVGTGSGVIALTLAAEWPAADVLAVDVSSEALALAGENADRLGLGVRVRFLQSDLLAGVTGEFDLLIANLPYIDSAVVQTLTREVLSDPVSALDGGDGGLDLLRRLIPQATRHLRGRLALEIGHDQGEAMQALLAAHNYRDIRVRSDYQERHRFVFAKYG
jgi:release factor glutamine methyltransferase